MLSMSNVSVEMAGSYFEKDDYYSSENGPGKPEFFGQAAQELGITSEFDHEVFENLLHGLSPDGSKQLIQIKPRELGERDLEKARHSFEKRIEKLGIPEEKAAFIRTSVVDKARGNKRHFTREESNELAAEVGKFISLLTLDSEAKQGLKKASAQLIKNLSKSAHRAGLDCTFSAPKSVSIACLVGGDDELLGAHKQAVDEAVKFIEARLAGTRVGSKDARQFARTGNVVGAKFHHGTSREGDPQLHTHCVIMNLTQKDKNNWRAMHTDPIYQHSKLAGLLYQNKLAELVQKKGYEIEVKTNGTFELKGYSEQQLSIFSKRRKQVMENSARVIFEDMKRNNLVREGDDFEKLKPELLQRVNQKMNRVSVTTDRQIKAGIKAANLKSRWQGEAKEHGVSHPRAESRRPLFGTKLDSDFAKEHLTERKSVVKKLDLIIQNLSRNLGRATSREIAKAGLQDLDLLTSNREPGSMASLSHAAREAEITRIVGAGKGLFSDLIRDERHGRLTERKGALTSDQKRAIEVTATSKDQMLIWNGVAGAGKTWALKEVKENAAKNGYRVVALAPDATSASVLGRQLGASSSTVHSYLRNDKASGKTLLIVDEAGKFSTKLMRDLLKKVEGTQTRLILSGDHRQLGAVEAGNPYKALLGSGVTVADLNESVRQKSPELKTAVAAVSTQKPQAIRWAADQLKDKIVERKSIAARINAVVKWYEKMAPEERKNALLITDTNHERALLTAQLREAKKGFGELGAKEQDLKILVSRDLSEAQRRCAEYFRKGDIVVTNVKSPTLAMGHRYVVEGMEGGRLQVHDGSRKGSFNPAAENISVYQLQTIKVAEKEALEWRRNHDGRENREKVTLVGLANGSAVLQTQYGEKVRIDLKKPQFIDYAHVSTTYASQGATADRVLALMQSNTSRESFYVAVSRARHDVQVVTDDKAKLVQRALKSSAKENALEHIDAPKFSLDPQNRKIPEQSRT